MTTQSDLTRQFESYVSGRGGDFSKFYAGITNDVERRFDEHNVDRSNGRGISGQAQRARVARNVERHLIAQGCAGGSGGGSDDAVYVYLYEMTAETQE